MAVIEAAFAAAYQVGDAVAFLVLASAGLAVVFGMMGVVNLAHGEFIMCGAYVSAAATRHGVPLAAAVALGALAAGCAGAALERLVVRHLYGRPLDTIVATWGVSFIATQGTLIVLGPSLRGSGTPLGNFSVGDYTYSEYRLALMGAAAVLLAALYLLFHRTRFGLRARATIQAPHMAEAIGVNTGRVYAATFGLGAALAGLAGGLYAPTMTLVPTMGAAFVMEAFVTVVVGGADVFVGMAPAAAVLGIVKAAMTGWQGQLYGQIGLLVAVILAVRLLPKGISGAVLRERG